MFKRVEQKVEKVILTALLGEADPSTYRQFLEHLRNGELETRKVEIDFPDDPKPGEFIEMLSRTGR